MTPDAANSEPAGANHMTHDGAPRPITDRRRRRATVPALAIAAGLIASIASAPSTVQAAETAHITRIHAHGYGGHVGIDVPGGGPYQSFHYWAPNGTIGPLPVLGTPPWVRFEFYPNTNEQSHDYDLWDLDVGGIHVERRRDDHGAGLLQLGELVLPRLGHSNGGAVAVRIEADIVASTPIPDGRLEIDAFQVPTVFPDPPRPIPTNANGVEYGAFAHGENRGARWSAGVGWPGRYVLFFRDTATGNHIKAFQDLGYGNDPALDLDAVCFGLDTCQYLKGGPGSTAGTFHPTAPIRVLDTRLGTGIDNGPVRHGGGRIDEPNPLIRRDEVRNHELTVTGVAGIPTVGVSAVLLNVTAVEPPGPGFLSVTPKGPHTGSELAIFDDLGSVPHQPPDTSNLNMSEGRTTPNLVLARVGAGGKIRFYNSTGSMHVIADVAGWFGTSTNLPTGLGFAGTTPDRILDSRDGTGTTATPFTPGETRTVQVAGRSGVPADAESVVVNLTVTGATGPGFAVAYPKGDALPTASNLNFSAGDTRANLAVVKVGDDGAIAIHVVDASADILVDVMGSFGPGGSAVTAIEPVRLADSRVGNGLPVGMIPADTEVPIVLAGRSGIPRDATAVIVNATAVDPVSGGFLTLWPSQRTLPPSSNVNYRPGETVPNMVMLDLGPDGAIMVRSGVAHTHLLIDVFGYMR